MIERSADAYEVTCDHKGCNEFIEIDRANSWSEMIAELKEAGWVIYKDADGDFCHKCPICKGERSYERPSRQAKT